MANSKRKSHCNKKVHKTLLSAQIALEVWTRRKKKAGEPPVTNMHAYACEYCPHFHIGRSRVLGINWKVVDAENRRIEELRKRSV